MSNPISQIPTEQLTHELWKKSKDQAEKEKDWQIAEHSRPIILSELTNHYAAKGDSISAAEKKARTSQEYRECIQKLGEIRSDLVLARARVSAVEYEIKLRINRSFKERSEYNAGHITT